MKAQRCGIRHSHPGLFNQYGGTNKVGLLQLESQATYNLIGGVLDADISFGTMGLDGSYPSGSVVLNQTGVEIKRPLRILRGTYFLENGVNHGATVPIDAGRPWGGNANAVQSGGTNAGSLNIGSGGLGSYVLNNGVSMASRLTVGALGYFQQYGGTQTVTGILSVTAGWTARERWSWGRFELHGGNLEAGSMVVDGSYSQSGGSNYVATDVTLRSSISGGNAPTLAAGVLTENNLTVTYRSVIQRAGLHIIRSNLTLNGRGTASIPYGGYEYDLAGGILSVSNIVLQAANLTLTRGTLVQSGTLTMGTGRLLPRNGVHELGVLNLQLNERQTNSTISFPPNEPCLMHFRGSWNQIWNRAATLQITNWTGSLYGSGPHQIIFGTTRLGLTPLQLGQIRFQSPLGVRGSFPSRILPTGEIVPALLLEQRRKERQLILEWNHEFVLQSAPTLTATSLRLSML